MAIVSTGMHDTLIFRRIFCLSLFRNWQRIHIRTKPYHWARPLAPQHCDHTRTTHLFIRNSQLIQLAADDALCTGFFPTQFWMPVDITPQANQAFLMPPSLFQNIHTISPVYWVVINCPPPQTASISPVINEARSEARNTAPFATSSGVHIRFRI